MGAASGATRKDSTISAAAAPPPSDICSALLKASTSETQASVNVGRKPHGCSIAVKLSADAIFPDRKLWMCEITEIPCVYFDKDTASKKNPLIDRERKKIKLQTAELKCSSECETV
ncbi:2-oxoglutarate-dependent dioxygenase family protein [Striga asiatica]|uniref:2-oxoglutarate-dependent dioxygenase family protein n=1 Tax=Striga asiatica TaxID=4170 RepID=A0A5A7R560_STRAF|nr:2-oxoglutarate-dependent dioxygenase family protein [Striga asiatica]